MLSYEYKGASSVGKTCIDWLPQLLLICTFPNRGFPSTSVACKAPERNWEVCSPYCSDPLRHEVSSLGPWAGTSQCQVPPSPKLPSEANSLIYHGKILLCRGRRLMYFVYFQTPINVFCAAGEQRIFSSCRCYPAYH